MVRIAVQVRFGDDVFTRDTFRPSTARRLMTCARDIARTLPATTVTAAAAASVSSIVDHVNISTALGSSVARDHERNRRRTNTTSIAASELNERIGQTGFTPSMDARQAAAEEIEEEAAMLQQRYVYFVISDSLAFRKSAKVSCLLCEHTNTNK